MPAPIDLPAALFLHAETCPEEPWLFRSEGWDWRWQSWGEIARQVRARVETLSEQAGSRYTFAYTAQPEDVILDLAIQVAGLVAAPFSGPPPEPSPLAPLPPPPFPPHRERGKQQERSKTSSYPAPSSPGEVGREGAGEEGRGGEGGGGAVVLRDGQPVELSAADLIAMANRIQELIEPAGKREIVVLGGPLENPDERAMLSWATLAGAAVVLEPNPALRAATAAWVRPTIFHGTAEELSALREWAAREKQGWLRRSPRLPFRRLRKVLVTGPEALADKEEAFWADRGVRVARI